MIQKLRQLFGSSGAGQFSSARLALWICLLTWFVRFYFLAIPIRVYPEEMQMDSWDSNFWAYEFVHTHDWAEKWSMLDRLSGSRSIIWGLAHLLWSYLLPGSGTSAFALTPVCGVVAMVAIAGAARRLFDLRGASRGSSLCLLLASVSPLFLLYSVQVTEAMMSAMWICLALYFLSGSRWRIGDLLLGGFFLGTAYAMSDASEPAALAIAAGLLVSLPMILTRRDLSIGKRLIRFIGGPVLYAGSAFVVPCAIYYWSQYAGNSNADRLLDPAGLRAAGWSLRPSDGISSLNAAWFRQMMELDPMLEAAFCAAAISLLRVRTMRWSLRIALFAASICAAWLLWHSAAGAPHRALVSLIVFGALGAAGILIPSAAVPAEKSETGDPAGDNPGCIVAPSPPLNGYGLAAACLILLYMYSRWPQLGGMPRYTFSSWPLFLLGLTGLLLAVFRTRFELFFRLAALGGIIMFLVGTLSAFRAKNVDFRASTYIFQHNHMRKLDYKALMTEPFPLGVIKKTGPHPAVVFGDLWPYYPGFVYDVPDFKPEVVEDRLRAHDLAWMIKPGLGYFSRIIYEADDETGTVLPPPGTPETPLRVEPDSEIKGNYLAEADFYRGLELHVPALRGEGAAETAAVVELPTNVQEETLTSFGFEWGCVTPYVPMDPGLKAKLTLRVEFHGKVIALLETPTYPKVPDDNYALGRTTFYQSFLSPIVVGPGNEKIRFVARVELPKNPNPNGENVYCPAVSCYVRRPYLSGRAYPLKLIPGYSTLIEADQEMALYPNYNGQPTLLALTRAGQGMNIKGVKWNSALWSGKPEHQLVFACSFDGVAVCSLEINGKHALDFDPGSANHSWSQDGIELRMKSMGSNMGNHAVMYLRLPEGYSPPNQSVQLAVRVTQAKEGQAWFGIRAMSDASAFPPAP